MLLKAQSYPVSQLHHSGSLTLETHRSAPQRQAGLLYTQLCSGVKRIFAAEDVYPYSNPALKTLALDPQLRKTWQHVEGHLNRRTDTGLSNYKAPVPCCLPPHLEKTAGPAAGPGQIVQNGMTG
ncbi:hypothetical protein PENANT_c095G09300 [Penicillium antarcticum]|uniref:Uncharacterized protein n=1 Tax=Penicillium antarcticum TaxID=416450 RepID=A0A1V6PNB6_9EURO|nr:hypothetical protein PENANT_c095G09300 [Penicillium antarcticum]